MTQRSFSAAMRAAGLRQVDVARMAGVDRSTVWRWCRGEPEAPEYAWTIVRQQQRIKSLAAEAVK